MNGKINEISEKSRTFFTNLESLVSGIYDTIKTSRAEDQSFPTEKGQFKDWAKLVLEKAKGDVEDGAPDLISSFKDLVVTLGVSESMFTEVFIRNKKQSYESLFGETVAVVALLLAWKEEDKEEFSQTLGEIGAASVFAANPVTGLIAVVGIALGYQKLYHAEAVKKGFLVGFVGIGVSSLVPGGFIVSIVAALTAVIIVNRELDINRPIEEQIMDYYKRFNLQAISEKLEDVYKNSPLYGLTAAKTANQ